MQELLLKDHNIYEIYDIEVLIITILLKLYNS